MGVSDIIVIPFYKKKISPIQFPVALLGFTNNNVFKGDLYDRNIGNWEINSEWKLPKLYNTIICTRCAYFAKDPKDFIARCYNSLQPNGILYVDWGLGDHWRFKNYKVGWVKDGEQEYAYGNNNYLWSCIFSEKFTENPHYQQFEKEIKRYGYSDLKKSIMEEVPSVLSEAEVLSVFGNINFDLLCIREPYLQLYILMSSKKD